MKVSELKNNKLEREYQVTVEAETLNRKMDEQLKSIGNRVKIPGFRPGHIPVKLLKQRYGKSVMGEVLENTVNSTSGDVIRERNERPAMQPKIEILSFEEGKELQYKMSYEVLPEIPEVDFAKVKLEKLSYDIPEKELTEGLERLAERRKSYEVKKGAAKLGDAVKIDFTGYLNGEKFEGGASENFTLELGSNQFIPGFEEQLVGAKAGDEKTVKVSFPEDYHSKDLAGKPTEFKVVVHEVLESKPVKIDDDFAKGLGLEGLSELKKALGEQLSKDYDQMVRAKLKKQLFDQLDTAYAFEAPKTMVEMEFNSIWERLQEAQKAGDESVNKPEVELRKEYQAIAERRVRLGLLLADIGRRNNLKVGQDELSRAVMEQARQYPGQEKKIFEYYQQNPQQLEELRGPILEEKAVDFILGQAKVADKKTTIDELMREEDEDAPKAKKAGKKDSAKDEAKPAAKKPAAKKESDATDKPAAKTKKKPA